MANTDLPPSPERVARIATAISVALALAAQACNENETHPREHDPYKATTSKPLECVPNLDGLIEAQELRAFVDNPISYLVSPAGAERAVDVGGVADAAGKVKWDWGAEVASDQVVRIAARSLEGAWYAASFPGAQFVAPFDAGGTVHAVYKHDAEAIWLLGLASAAQDPPEGRTLLPYQAAVALYRFPLALGSQWVSVGKIDNGTMRGLPYAGRDVYEVKADAVGQMVLPDLTFTQAHRVRTRVTVEPAVGASTSQRQVSFFFECFGEVARATSRLGEAEENFKTAIEVRRLGL
jgi:hypothetical protein